MKWLDWAIQGALGGLMLAAAFGAAMMLLVAFGATGPNCPGKDPSWIGWCSEAPDAW